MKIWGTTKKSFRYLRDIKGEWNRDNLKEIYANRLKADERFHNERQTLLDLQQKERLLAQAVENEKNRDTQKWNAQLYADTLSIEGLLNRDLQNKLSKLNHKNSYDLEILRQEYNSQIVEKQKEIQIELKAIDAEIAKEFRRIDRETALNNIREQKRINNSPLYILSEDIISSKQNETNNETIHILYSPPHLNIENNKNNSFPLSDEIFINNLRDIFDRYKSNGHSLHFIGGAWQNKEIKGEAVAEILHKQLKTESIFILENIVENDIFYINIMFWASNSSKYSYHNVASFSWNELINNIVKNRVENIAKDISKQNISIDAYKEIVGKESFENYLSNLSVKDREAKAIEQGIALSNIDRNYITNKEDTKNLIKLLSTLNQYFSGLYLDNYYLLHNQNSKYISPLLPTLIQSSFFDFLEKDDLIKNLPEFYDPSFKSILEEEANSDNYFIQIDYAKLLLSLSFDDKAEKEALYSLRKFFKVELPNIFISSKISLIDLTSHIPDSIIKYNKSYFKFFLSYLNLSTSSVYTDFKQKLTSIMESPNPQLNNSFFYNILPEIKTLYIEAIKIANTIVSNYDNYSESINSQIITRLKEWANKCESQSFQIAIMALVKSGKSTFINALLGNEFLPMANTPETTFPIRIIHINEEANSFLKNGEIIVANGDREIYTFLKNVNTEYRNNTVQESYDLVLYSNVKALSGSVSNNIIFEVIDTPGFGEAEQELLQKKKLSQTNADLLDNISVIIYLLDYTKLKTESEDEAIKKLMTLRPDIIEKISERLFFVINKIDLENRDGLAPEEVIDYVHDIIRRKIPQISKEQIFTISASDALLARLILDNKASEKAKIDFRKVAFGREVNKTEEEFKDKAIEILKDSKIEEIEYNILEYIYDNRGKILIETLIDNLIRLLNDLKNKYILTAEGILNASLKEIEELEQKIDATKKKQERLDLETENFEKEIREFINNHFKAYKEKLKGKLNHLFSDAELNDEVNKGFFKKLKSKISDFFSTSSSKIKTNITDKVKELNSLIYNELKEDFGVFKSNLEYNVLIKQTELFKQLENSVNEMARELEGVINKSLNIDLKPVTFQIAFTDLDSIKVNANATLERFIKSRKVETTVKKTKSVFRESESCWEDDRYENVEYYENENYNEYEISKPSLQLFWQEEVEKMNENAIVIAEQLIESSIKSELKKAKNVFNDLIEDYLFTIKFEKKRKENIGTKYINIRLQELEASKHKVDELLNIGAKLQHQHF